MIIHYQILEGRTLTTVIQMRIYYVQGLLYHKNILNIVKWGTGEHERKVLVELYIKVLD